MPLAIPKTSAATAADLGDVAAPAIVSVDDILDQINDSLATVLAEPGVYVTDGEWVAFAEAPPHRLVVRRIVFVTALAKRGTLAPATGDTIIETGVASGDLAGGTWTRDSGTYATGVLIEGAQFRLTRVPLAAKGVVAARTSSTTISLTDATGADSQTVLSATGDGATVTYTLVDTPRMSVGAPVTVAGMSDDTYNSASGLAVTAIDGNNVTIALSGASGTAQSGTLTFAYEAEAYEMFVGPGGFVPNGLTLTWTELTQDDRDAVTGLFADFSINSFLDESDVADNELRMTTPKHEVNNN